MDDIAPELLAKVQEEFKKQFDRNSTIKELAKKLEDGTATHVEAFNYAGTTGSILTDAYHKFISPDTLPDGKLWYNIADRVITPTMRNNYEVISNYVSQVQENLNRAAGLNIKAVKTKLNEDRIKGIVNRVSSADKYKDVEWVLNEPVKSFGKSVVDDSIRENVDFHGKAGLQPKIVRKSSGDCCKWCNAIAGTYRYPDVPKDVYRRHSNCNCTVEYDPGDGSRQNVHTKRWRNEAEYDKIEYRKNLSNGRIKYDRNYAKANDYLDYGDVFPNPNISPDEIIKELEASPIGKEILKYITDTGVKPKLIYTPRYDGVRGDQLGTEIRIFMANISNTVKAAQTIIHEMTHYKYDIGGCQWAEAVCMANEKKHIAGRNELTQAELKYIVKLAKEAYPEYQWKRGGHYGNRRF